MAELTIICKEKCICHTCKDQDGCCKNFCSDEEKHPLTSMTVFWDKVCASCWTPKN